MKKHLFLIDKRNGSSDLLDSITDDIVENQVLVIEGVDSEFISDFAVGNDDDSYVYYGKFLISKYSDHNGDENLNLFVGNNKIISIKRVLPKIEFEINFIKDGSTTVEKRIFSSVHEGLKILAQE